MTGLRPEPVVEVAGLTREYRSGEGIVVALFDVNLSLAGGELVALHGRSGSGKTTLLNLVGGLERPTRGRVWVHGEEVTALPEAALLRLRRDRIGFVFQAFGLIPILSAAENVEIPLRMRGEPPRGRDARVAALLDRVGLAGRARHRPHELSGGEQQRVAIARALANDPRLVLADESTGQLDSANSRNVVALLRDLVDDSGVTVLMATHDPSVLAVADRAVELRDGRVVP